MALPLVNVGTVAGDGTGDKGQVPFQKVNAGLTAINVLNGGGVGVGALFVGSSSSELSYTASGTGAVARTVQSKLQETASVEDYGGVSGTDCSAAVTLAAAANNEVIFPAGVWIMGTTPTVPLGVVLNALPGSSFSGAGATALALTNPDSNQWNVVEGTAAGDAFVDVLRINHSYGGTGMTGGRNSLEVESGLVATSSSTNPNRNYVAAQFSCHGSANDTGTNPTIEADSAGAFFGIGAEATLSAGATSILNATAAEFDVTTAAGSSLFFRSGIQIVDLESAVQGAGFDAGIALSAFGAGVVGFANGILFSNSNGAHPVSTTGNLIATQGAHTVAGGINFTSYTFTGDSFAATGFAVAGNGSEIDFGVAGTANTYLTNFHTGATAAPNFDSRIVATGGNGSNGGGGMVFNSSALGFFTASAPAAQATGYGTPTGGSHQGSFAAGSITLPNLAAAVAQLIIDLESYSLIGA
jgi:hypothetical protein